MRPSPRPARARARPSRPWPSPPPPAWRLPPPPGGSPLWQLQLKPRKRMKKWIEIPPNFERLFLGCIEADFWVKTRVKALYEIYKIYRLLHRSGFKSSFFFFPFFRLHWSFACKKKNSSISSGSFAFLQFYSQCFTLLFANVIQNSPMLSSFDENLSEFLQFFREISKYPRLSNFLRSRNEICWIFQKLFSRSSKKIENKIIQNRS